MNLNHPTRLFLIMLGALVALLGACSSSESDEGDGAPDADQILEQAATTFEDTESAHFVLEIDGTIGIDEEGMLELGAVEGDIARPASAQANADVNFAGSSVTMEMIAADGQMYLRNILTGDWERAPSDLQYDPARIFDGEQGIGSIIAQLGELELVGEDSIDGTDAWHLTAVVDTPEVQALAGNFFEGDQLDIDIWVATEDHRLLQVELHDSAAEEPTSWELSLSDHGEPVEITPPDLE